MSKYDPLRRHLEQYTDHTWHATFHDIERIPGFRLPDSARLHQAWWANSHDHMPQHRAWIDAGWRTSDLNLSAEHVLFRRSVSASPRSTPVDLPSRAIAPHQWDNSPRGLACGLGMTWKPLGRVERDAAGRLTLPSASAFPAERTEHAWRSR